ncbi:nitroreductase family deazaflavin-dependent oxidoreductase [Actinocorallia sp. B10E7]|uniref:nitroreductase family deazaflavin-dependent oxidoreductase n=1 Tax=Actinocorallia sp. B10E7 TaxID=3153558 RepID=UPI00325F371E
MSTQSPLIQRVFGPPFQKISGAPWFSKVGPKVVPGLDRTLHKVTGGRVMLSQLLVPTLYLTTIGAKSGEERISPLLCMPESGGWIVVGSNFGQDKHPAWTGNLLKTPEATVEYEKKVHKVTGDLLTDEERARVWQRLTEVWPVYYRYQARVDRELRIFRLTPR